MKLFVLAVGDVNRHSDAGELSYARKATIHTGMVLTMNGLWEEIQMFLVFQENIKKHRNHFEFCRCILEPVMSFNFATIIEGIGIEVAHVK